MLALAATAVSAATFAAKNGGIVMTGMIEDNDQQRLAAIIDRRANGGNPLKVVELNSTGGKVDPAIEISNLIRRNGISTFVGAGDTCASACFLVFAGGTSRHAFPNSRIGVHRVSDLHGSEMAAGTVMMADIYAKVGVPPIIIGKMASTPPGHVTWLTNDDLRAMNVTIRDFIEQPPTYKPQTQPTLESAPGLPIAFNCTAVIDRFGQPTPLNFSLNSARGGGKSEFSDSDRNVWISSGDDVNTVFSRPADSDFTSLITFDSYAFTNERSWHGSIALKKTDASAPIVIGHLDCQRLPPPPRVAPSDTLEQRNASWDKTWTMVLRNGGDVTKKCARHCAITNTGPDNRGRTVLMQIDEFGDGSIERDYCRVVDEDHRNCTDWDSGKKSVYHWENEKWTLQE